MIPAFIATLLFSCSILFGHRAARLAGGVEANFWRLVCSTTFLGVWSYSCGIGLGGEAFPWFFFSGIIGFGIGDVALSYRTNACRPATAGNGAALITEFRYLRAGSISR